MTAYVNQSFELTEVLEIGITAYKADGTSGSAPERKMEEVKLEVEKEKEHVGNEIDKQLQIAGTPGRAPQRKLKLVKIKIEKEEEHVGNKMDNKQLEITGTLGRAPERKLKLVKVKLEKEEEHVGNEMGNKQLEIPISVMGHKKSIAQGSSDEVTPQGTATCVAENCIKVNEAIGNLGKTTRMFDPNLKMKLNIFIGLWITFIVWLIVCFGIGL